AKKISSAVMWLWEELTISRICVPYFVTVVNTIFRIILILLYRFFRCGQGGKLPKISFLFLGRSVTLKQMEGRVSSECRTGWARSSPIRKMIFTKRPSRAHRVKKSLVQCRTEQGFS